MILYTAKLMKNHVLRMWFHKVNVFITVNEFDILNKMYKTLASNTVVNLQ